MRRAAFGALVLMYHRVCARTPATACWFARGTAVCPERFHAHVAWLADRVRIVPLDAAIEEVLAGRRHERPACALTFDDGYQDVILATELGLPVTVFAVSRHTGDARTPLWFDQYYGLLHSAQRRRDLGALDLGGAGSVVAPNLDTSLAWWVRGPVKDHLQRMVPQARGPWLDALAELLDAREMPNADALYLRHEDLRELVRSGHRVGGHGATHTRLTELAEAELDNELQEARTLLDDLGTQPVRLFSHPDGAYEARTKHATQHAGFEAACGVTEGVLDATMDRYAMPRILMRDVFPGEAGWPTALACLETSEHGEVAS